MNLQILQVRELTWCKEWLKFQACILLEHQVMVLQSQKTGCVWKTPFRKSGVGGKSVHQADVSGGGHFPRKFCPTGQDILSASRIICPGLGGKSVRQ